MTKRIRGPIITKSAATVMRARRAVADAGNVTFKAPNSRHIVTTTTPTTSTPTEAAPTPDETPAESPAPEEAPIPADEPTSGPAGSEPTTGSAGFDPVSSGGFPAGPSASGPPAARGDGNVERRRAPAGSAARTKAWLRRGGRGRVELRGTGPLGVVEISTPLTTPLVVAFEDFLLGRAHQVVRSKFGSVVVEEIRDEIRRRA